MSGSFSSPMLQSKKMVQPVERKITRQERALAKKKELQRQEMLERAVATAKTGKVGKNIRPIGKKSATGKARKRSRASSASKSGKGTVQIRNCEEDGDTKVDSIAKTNNRKSDQVQPVDPLDVPVEVQYESHKPEGDSTPTFTRATSEGRVEDNIALDEVNNHADCLGDSDAEFKELPSLPDDSWMSSRILKDGSKVTNDYFKKNRDEIRKKNDSPDSETMFSEVIETIEGEHIKDNQAAGTSDSASACDSVQNIDEKRTDVSAKETADSKAIS